MNRAPRLRSNARSFRPGLFGFCFGCGLFCGWFFCCGLFGGRLDFLDLRRVERERSLNADPERLLSDGERLSRARALPFDHDALENLDTPALALDHLKVNADGIARLESGAIAAQLPLLEVLDDTMHKNGPRWGRRPML